MMTTNPAKKKYEVLNPRKLDEGSRIIAFGPDMWYAGDEFEQPDRMSQEQLDEFIARGYLKDPDGEINNDVETVTLTSGDIGEIVS